MPSARGARWDGQDGLFLARGLPETAGAGQQAVDVDFEVPTPQRAEELRQRGVQLPRVSEGLGDPRAHRDFIDARVTGVGFGITAGGYLLYCEGLPLPVLVPESHVDLGLTSAEPLNESIYPDRDAALADMAASAPASGRARYAWYRGAGGALIVLQGVFSRAVRMGLEPAPRSMARNEGPGGEAPTPRQPAPRSAAPAPEPAPAPAAPAPSPGSPAPSSGLVQALAGNNPTRPVAPGPRFPQDVAVNPKVPGELPTDRPIGLSPTQNAQVQADIRYLRSIGADNIRVNQQQITLESVQRVGTNRPDLQFDYNNRRYHVEYDTPASGRGPGHQSRITSNDPDAETILIIVP